MDKLLSRLKKRKAKEKKYEQLFVLLFFRYYTVRPVLCIVSRPTKHNKYSSHQLKISLTLLKSDNNFINIVQSFIDHNVYNWAI